MLSEAAISTTPHTADDARLVESQLAAQCASFARFIAKWSIVVNALWWPSDGPTVVGLPGAFEGMRSLRVWVFATSLAALGVLWGCRELRGLRLALCALVWCVEVGATGGSMARVGDFATPWFHFLYPLVIASSVLPVALPARVAIASALGGSLLAGFLIVRPEGMRSPYLGPVLSYLTFTVGVAIAYGHRSYLVTRRAFLQQLALARSESQLAAQREGLREEVEARTAELRRLAEHLDRAGEHERRRIARELHDDLGQSVSAVRLALATTLRRYARSPGSVQANLDELDGLVCRVADSTRDTITRLRPRILEDRGLAAAARWLVTSAERHGDLAYTLSTEGLDALDVTEGEAPADGSTLDEVRSAAFRILQEALTNVQRHARARRVEVDLRVVDGALTLRVRDDGVGIAATREGAAGMGLVGMRERAAALHGSLTVGPAEGGGTVLLCRLPLAPQGGATS